jgi:hypothetical protein
MIRQIPVLLLIGVAALSTAHAVGLLGTPPTAIEVRAELIPAFDSMIPRASDLISSNFAVVLP